MKLYRVEGGVARLGPDMLIGLTKDQLAIRAHRVTVVNKLEGGAAVVRPNEALDFKVGETIRLQDDPPRNLIDILAPMEPPTTPIQKLAAEKTVDRHKRKAEEKRKAATKPGGKR